MEEEDTQFGSLGLEEDTSFWRRRTHSFGGGSLEDTVVTTQFVRRRRPAAKISVAHAEEDAQFATHKMVQRGPPAATIDLAHDRRAGAKEKKK